MVRASQNYFQLDVRRVPFSGSVWQKVEVTAPRTITVIGKAFFDINQLRQINQTGEPIFPATLRGKFIR